MPKEEQEAAARARKSALQFWELASNRPRRAALSMKESTSVHGIFRCADAKQTKFLVSELETALGVYPETAIRAEDLIRIDLPLSATELAILVQQVGSGLFSTLCVRDSSSNFSTCLPTSAELCAIASKLT